MNIPGQQVSHQIITYECRTNRGNDGALLESWNRISEEYWNLIGRGLDPHTELHLVLIVQMDRHRQSALPARDDELRRVRGVLEKIEGGYVEADENDLDAWIVEMQQMARAALASPSQPRTQEQANAHNP